MTLSTVKAPTPAQLRALSEVYASADAFVFPSLTDTFGIVLLEALASGLPIAAYPVTGPLDVIGTTGCGVLSDYLRLAALAAHVSHTTSELMDSVSFSPLQ